MERRLSPAFDEGSAIGKDVSDDSHPTGRLAKRAEAKTLTNPLTMKSILLRHNGFPDDGRTLVWRYMLKLPMAKSQYVLLAEQSIHPAVAENLSSMLCGGLVVQGDEQRLRRLLSALSYWHPPLSRCDWAASLAFAFVRSFGRDSLIAFEVTATFIVNWCRDWLDLTPSPPVTVLARVHSLAQSLGGSAPFEVAWPAMRSLFAEVATTEAALRLADFTLAARPGFYEALVAAYCCVCPKRRVEEQDVVPIVNKALSVYEPSNGDVFVPLQVPYPVLKGAQVTHTSRREELERIRREVRERAEKEKVRQENAEEEGRLAREQVAWLHERGERQALDQVEEFASAYLRRCRKDIEVE